MHPASHAQERVQKQGQEKPCAQPAVVSAKSHQTKVSLAFEEHVLHVKEVE
jgi:hypothetical protein